MVPFPVRDLLLDALLLEEVVEDDLALAGGHLRCGMGGIGLIRIDSMSVPALMVWPGIGRGVLEKHTCRTPRKQSEPQRTKKSKKKNKTYGVDDVDVAPRAVAVDHQVREDVRVQGGLADARGRVLRGADAGLLG